MGNDVRTYVYVDGFNLYYRSLRDTPFKWLDLTALVRRILSPEDQILKIKYFTALVVPTQRDPQKHIRQQTFIRAIETYIPEVEVCYGRFLESRKWMPRADPQQSPRFVEVIKVEEKGSDVNLGVHLVHDAAQDVCDCSVVISNDSDLAEALRVAKECYGKTVGVISPQHPIAADLRENACFFRYIRPRTLARCQLPDPIPNSSIRKPSVW
jgi:uncharacterized LabA/DUF88 family protein